MLTLPNYQIGNQIYESVNSLIYRGHRKKDNQLVILKMLKQDYPTPAELTRYQQEYEITHDFELAGVINAYSIKKYQNTLVIILEDFGGESLKQLMANRPLTVKAFLPIAIQIADSLGNIHAHNLIHKDINPSNIVINIDTNQLKIIDFGIASRLPREKGALKNPEQLEGTLAYFSPEQTGRINRALDYRTDLYSLGVTCYEMLTGFVPFTATDAMELVHCHLAKTPTPVCEVNPDIPKIVSDIVMKLMDKNAEERYQSAFGVKADLEKCLENIRCFENIECLDFELAQNDFSGKLQIPQKLYGRENEVNTLLQAFERVSLGKVEMMLVAGYSGVGKTALVHEVHKPMTSKRGYFAAGKFDQFQKNIPYSALSQAFNEFCRYLLMESAETLANWQTKILNAVGNNGQIIIDVVPDLELVIGTQPAVAKVGATEAQNRFQMFSLNFIKALCDKEHPFILFIDDLQWVDSASLGLLKSIMLDDEIQHLLIIGAYRDNEVDGSHPFIMAASELQKANVSINTIELANLQPEDVNLLLQDSLNCESARTQPLTDLIYQKTQGNAFFTHQFLQTLYFDALLRFDFEPHQWRWDVEQIAAQNITDNVVELMANKINKLPSKTSKVLQLAACIGNQFDLPILAIIYEQDKNETFKVLWDAIMEGLIQPLDENYKHLETASQSQFKFLHDRVQQAAYALIDDEQKQAVHLKIGRLLLANTGATELEERIFEIVNQLNQGIELITDDEEKHRLFQLNVDAGAKALSATAYHAALAYIEVGKTLISDSIWATDYAYAFKYYMKSAECLYINNQPSQAIEYLDLLVSQVQINSERIDLMKFKSLIYTAITDNVSAKKALLQALYLCGIDMETEEQQVEFLPKRYKEIVKRLQSSTADTLINAPTVTDVQDKLFINSLVNSYLPLMRSEDTVKTELSVLKSMEFVLNKGNDESTPLAYIQFGAYLCSQGEYSLGVKCGNIAMTINKQYFSKLTQSHLLFWYALHLIHFGNPIRESLSNYHKVYETSIELGDFVYAGYATTNILTNKMLCGVTLPDLKEAYRLEKDRAEKVGDANVFHILKPLKQLISSMEANTVALGCGDNSTFSEQEHFEGLIKNNLGVVTIWFMPIKTMLLAMAGSYAEVIAYSRQYQSYMDIMPNTFSVTVFYFYYVLALIKNGHEEDLAHPIIKQYRQKYEEWAKICPENYQNKYFLIEAESARVSGNVVDAIDFYEKAIAGSKENEYLNEEALAYELAAEFYLGRFMEKIAQTYLTEAHYRYQQWGALAKVRDLETRYPQFLAPKTAPAIPMDTNISAIRMAPTSTTGSSEWLDLNSVTKASQTLSGEIVLSRLLEKMMHIVIENAGAEKGFLLLPQQNNWFIEAQGLMDSSDTSVLQKLPLKESELVSANIIHYIARTFDNVVLHDATLEGSFTRDAYIIKQRPKSVLGMPLLNQGKLTGILYLENNLTTGAFTANRLKTLKMLSSQIAISIENSLLYNNLEQKITERTQELSTALDHLKTTQSQLVEAEKMASLGGLVAGVAHEINTPIGIGVTAASTLADRTTETVTAYDNKQLKGSALKAYFNTAQISSNLVLNNLNRAAELIQSFKQVAVDQSNLDKRFFAVKKYIQDTLINLKSHFKKTPHQITVNGDEQISINSYPGAFSQIMTNLVMNSLRHAYPKGETGNLCFELKLDSEHLIVEYSDDGCGIPPENLAKIFEPFFTTARAQGGTGLGLHIVFNLVTQKLQGTINVQSEIGLGTTFILNLPLQINNKG